MAVDVSAMDGRLMEKEHNGNKSWVRSASVCVHAKTPDTFIFPFSASSAFVITYALSGLLNLCYVIGVGCSDLNS